MQGGKGDSEGGECREGRMTNDRVCSCLPANV